MYKDRLPYSSLSHEECHKKLLECLDENHTLEVIKMLLVILLVLSIGLNVYFWHSAKQTEKIYKEAYNTFTVEAQKSADYYLGYFDGQHAANDSFADEIEKAKSESFISGFQSGLEKETSSSDYYDAYWQGNEDGYLTGYDEGYSIGWDDGHDSGYDAGYDEGYYDGIWDQ